MMPVAAAVLWKNIMLDPSFGFFSYYLRFFGIRNFYALEAFPLPTVIAIISWQWIPFVMLILLAGLQSLPDSTTEAARIDGASGFAMFRHIIIPHLRQFIEIALLLETIFILSEFGTIFVTTAGGPGIQTTNLPYPDFLRGVLETKRRTSERLRYFRRHFGQHRHRPLLARLTKQLQLR